MPNILWIMLHTYHHVRMKQLQSWLVCPDSWLGRFCRLKEDHHAKLKPLQELNQQLLAELSAKQQDNSQLEALQDQLERATSRLEMESSGRAELWQRCTALEQELHTVQDNLEVATRSLKRAEQQLGECCSTAHGQHLFRHDLQVAGVCKITGPSAVLD